MKKNGNPRPMAVWLLIALQFLLGVGALGGGGVLIAAPDGSIINMPLSMLEFSPFHNFLIPGMILFAGLGLFPLAIAYSLWQRPAWRWPDFFNPFRRMHWSWTASLAAGIILLIWITVEMLILRSIAFLQILYFAWGCVLIFLTLTASVRQYFTRSKR